jgi:hypothetical protein
LQTAITKPNQEMAARQNGHASGHADGNGNGTGNGSGGFQRRAKPSSHPEGHYRDKTKYNNRNGRFAKRDDASAGAGAGAAAASRNPQQNTFISQEELMEHLTAKLRGNKFVIVKTKQIQNDRGTLYEIDVINPGLFNIGNGTFFTLKLHTVSHKSRVIFIRIIFNDDEARNADMRINADAIIQILREIAPDTIERDSISIADVDDSKGNHHLAVLASTVKGASLNYTYERIMEFVHVVDEKYGSSGSGASSNQDGASASGDDGAGAGAGASADMSEDQIDAESALLEKKLKALQELKLAKTNASANPESNSETTNDAQKRILPSKVTFTIGNKTTTFPVKQKE